MSDAYDLVQPWRKTFPICRPPIPGDILRIHQKDYITQIYNKFMTKQNHGIYAAPVVAGKEGHKAFMDMRCAETDAERTAMADKNYLALLGCIAYVANKLRPDASYYVAFLGQFSKDPWIQNYNAGLQVLGYLYNTREVGITYDGRVKVPELGTCDPPLNIDNYVKSHGLGAWSDASEGSKGQAGYAITRCNAAVCWASRKIKVTTSGSTDAETVAGVACTKDLKFTRHLIAFISDAVEDPTPLFIDNSGMWFNIRNEVASSGNRHWDSWQHYTREAFLFKLLVPHKIDTEDENADILTKAMARGDGKFAKFRNNLVNIPKG